MLGLSLRVRLRAHPVGDTASKTKRCGRNLSALQAKINFGHRKRGKRNDEAIRNTFKRIATGVNTPSQ